jgi:hypothetical protein
MFEQRPHAALVPQTIVRNGRTNGWIVTVPNRTFLAHLGAGYVSERRAAVALPPAGPAPRRRVDAPRIVAALVVLIGVTVIAVTLAI